MHKVAAQRRAIFPLRQLHHHLPGLVATPLHMRRWHIHDQLILSAVIGGAHNAELPARIGGVASRRIEGLPHAQTKQANTLARRAVFIIGSEFDLIVGLFLGLGAVHIKPNGFVFPVGDSRIERLAPRCAEQYCAFLSAQVVAAQMRKLGIRVIGADNILS
jgi:hypothetical protein